MSVKLYEPGDEDGEGIAVLATYLDLQTLRINLQKKEDGAISSFVVFIAVGDPDEENGRTIMEMSNAKTVNLWFQMNDEGNQMNLVFDPDIVPKLEQILQHYQTSTRH